MEEIGKYLKRARLDRKLSLSDIEQDTKISSRYLKALEEDDFNALPGRTYAIGFLRTYSRYLSLDDQHLVDILKGFYNKDDQAEAFLVMKPPTEVPADPEAMSYVNKRKLQPWKVLFLVLLVGGLAVAGVLYYVGTGDQSGTAQTNNPSSQDPTQTPSSGDDNTNTPTPGNTPSTNGTPSNTQTDTPNNPTTPATQTEGLELLISADYGNCWIKVTADGQTTDFTLSKGGSKTIVANEYITIKLGSAGAVRLTLNGQEQPALGQIGDVVSTTYRVEQ